MRGSRLLLLVGGLALALLASLVVAEGQAQRFPPLTTYSPQADGARALWLWLEDAGAPLERLETAPFEVGAATGLLFVLEPSVFLEPGHLEALEAWTRQGGTLVVAGSRLPARQVLDRFGFSLSPVAPPVERAAPAQPLFGEPWPEQVVLGATDVLEPRSAAAVPLLADDGRLLAAVAEVGEGRVIALASAFPLSNAGLAQGDNAALALHLMSLASPGSRVAFDEYHHGFIRREQQTALELTLRSRWGWAGLYAGLLVLAYLGLSGRRFGRPVPLARQRTRGVAEYVRSMAGLYRRAGQRRFIARHEAQQARRRLARELGLDPALPLPALAEWFRRRGHPRPEVLAVLERLEREGPLSEAELVRLVREAEVLTEVAVGSRR